MKNLWVEVKIEIMYQFIIGAKQTRLTLPMPSFSRSTSLPHSQLLYWTSPCPSWAGRKGMVAVVFITISLCCSFLTLLPCPSMVLSQNMRSFRTHLRQCVSPTGHSSCQNQLWRRLSIAHSSWREHPPAPIWDSSWNQCGYVLRHGLPCLLWCLEHILLTLFLWRWCLKGCFYTLSISYALFYCAVLPFLKHDFKEVDQLSLIGSSVFCGGTTVEVSVSSTGQSLKFWVRPHQQSPCPLTKALPCKPHTKTFPVIQKTVAEQEDIIYSLFLQLYHKLDSVSPKHKYLTTSPSDIIALDTVWDFKKVMKYRTTPANSYFCLPQAHLFLSWVECIPAKKTYFQQRSSTQICDSLYTYLFMHVQIYTPHKTKRKLQTALLRKTYCRN